MGKGLRHTVTSWVAIVSFVAYSIAVPTAAYADNPTPPPAPSTELSVNLSSCEIIGLSSLTINTPRLQLGDTGSVYDIGSRYKIFDTTTNQQLSLEGTFLTRPAAASLLVGLQNIEGLWQVELNRILAYNNACWQYRLSLSQATITSRDAQIVALNEQMATRIQIRDDQIEFLTSNLRPPAWYESGEFWFAVGLVAGISLTIGAGYALGQANN